MLRDRTRGAREEGFALITVMLATFAMLSLAAAAVAYGIGSQDLSRRDQDWNASLSAAEAGVDDFVFHLNENGNYWQYSSVSPPPDGNQAFSGWQAVQGPANQSKFHYVADTSKLTTQGTITLSSSGRTGRKTTTRTIQATVRRRSFIDYLYFTDFETIDPATYPNSSSSATSAWAQTNCSKHFYEGRPEGTNECVPINFISADTINGPLHSNDAILMCGTPHFNGNTSSSWNNVPRWRGNSACAPNAPVFATAGDPALLSPLTMPPSNSAIKSETAAGVGGCLYTGPTKITLLSSGQMTVDSKFSKQTNNGCPTNGTGALPSNGVIYVQSVPSSSSDPNYTAGCPYSVGGVSHPLGYPITNDTTTYACRNGDVFLSGTLKGQVTIGSENDIDLTGNVTYNGGLGGTDLLGLVANNYVQIYHPVQLQTTNYSPPRASNNPPPSCGGSWQLQTNVTNSSGQYTQQLCSKNLTGAVANPQIYAAILSVQHSFRVQNWSLGAPPGSPLGIQGAIAQRYRGAVGTNSGGTIVSGYAKSYTYDNRLKYLSPPKFLDPVAAAWGSTTWAEIVNPAGLPA